MSKGNYLYDKMTRATITTWDQIPAEHHTQLLLGTPLPPHIHPAKVPKVKTTSHAWMTAFMGLTATDTHTIQKLQQHHGANLTDKTKQQTPSIIGKTTTRHEEQ